MTKEELISKLWCIYAGEKEAVEDVVNAYDKLQHRINNAIEFVESMRYCGMEEFFYDMTCKDKNGNDSDFDDSKERLLKILRSEDNGQ